MNKKYLKLLNEGWERGSQTFADLGLEDAQELEAKAYLRAAILSRISALNITQREAARRVGIPQPKMSILMSDQTPRGFSSDRLMDFAVKLGLDVRIEVSPSKNDIGKLILDNVPLMLQDGQRLVRLPDTQIAKARRSASLRSRS
jgi:predicted XRE-type DNA-binding protein